MKNFRLIRKLLKYTALFKPVTQDQKATKHWEDNIVSNIMHIFDYQSRE
jgi:hypothetical protein